MIRARICRTYPTWVWQCIVDTVYCLTELNRQLKHPAHIFHCEILFTWILTLITKLMPLNIINNYFGFTNYTKLIKIATLPSSFNYYYYTSHCSQRLAHFRVWLFTFNSKISHIIFNSLKKIHTTEDYDLHCQHTRSSTPTRSPQAS
jgi:hypothetical protein